MNPYKAKVYSKDKRFNGMPIVFDSRVSINPNTKLQWIEPLKNNPSDAEVVWYNKALELVVKDD